MENILIFSGTSDGGKTAEYLARNGYEVTVSTATAYGGKCAPKGEHITVRSGRMDREEICELLKSGFTKVIDATHPYAEEVSRLIREAADETGTAHYRLLRNDGEADGVIRVDSTKAAAEYLRQQEGTALITTGSKELSAYTIIEDYRNRLVVRVLSTAESIEKCRELGFEGRNLIAMQGPFSEDMNAAMLKETGAKWLVTKASGHAGGFEEKLAAAKRAGASVILIRRPAQDEKGYAYSELIRELTGSAPEKEVALVGIGPGSRGGMTEDAEQAFREAELIIGAGRMLEAVRGFGGTTFAAYKADEIVSEIAASECTHIAVALSGDTGFYSGAKRLCALLEEQENIRVRMVPGLSSVICLAAKCKVSWDDALILSLHGRTCNLAAKVKHNRKIFLIAGRGSELSETFGMLAGYGFGDVKATVGSELSYETEEIVSAPITKLAEIPLPDLSVVLFENENPEPQMRFASIPDEAFLRGKVPMTKEEVRTVSVSKLRLTADSVVYDIGAGTGSVSIETALIAEDGMVYAIERKEEACELIEKNKKAFAADNLEIVRGLAPEALETLPKPTHAFIGGSAGNMREIVETVLAKNPAARFVINTIAMESTAEALGIVSSMPVTDVDIVQVTAAKAKKLSNYNMMTGANPVYVISFSGRTM